MSRSKVPSFSPAVDFSEPGEYSVMVPPEILQRSSVYQGPARSSTTTAARDAETTDEECFFNVRYSFHPDSIDPQKPVAMTKEKDEYVLEAQTFAPADSSLHVFSGRATPAKDLECVLIYNDRTGQFELRPLSSTLRVQPDKQRQQKIIISRDGGERNKKIQTPPAMDLLTAGSYPEVISVDASANPSPSSTTPQISSKSLPKTTTTTLNTPASTAEVYHDEDEIDFDDELAGQLEQELLDDIDFDFDDEEPPALASGNVQTNQSFTPSSINTSAASTLARSTERESSPILEVIESVSPRRPEPPKSLRGLSALSSSAKPISLRNLAGNSRYDEDELSSSEEE